jgi:AcrR family transcriptional regulator
VVAAALDLIDQDGIDALSMRKLGQRLGVEAMSLYNHVTSKDDLLDGVASLLLELVDVEDPATGDWRSRAAAIADSVRAVGLDHPRAFPLLASRKLSSLQSWAPIEAAFTLAQRAGLDDIDSLTVVTTMEGYILGFVLLEIGMRALEAEGRCLTLDDVPPEETTLRRYLATRSGLSFDERYRHGIELILDGIDQRIGRTADAADRPAGWSAPSAAPARA